MTKEVSATNLRANLFDLLDAVIHRGERVVASRCGDGGRAVIVEEGYLRRIEAQAEKLVTQSRRPFQLRGSLKIRTGGDVERMLSELRAREREEFERRAVEIAVRPPSRRDRTLPQPAADHS